MRKKEHHLLLSWMILVSLMAFGLFVAWREEVIMLLYRGDSSKLSWVITLLFVIMLCHCARRAWFLSCEINAAGQATALLQEGALEARDGWARAGGRALPDCLLTRHLLDLLHQGQVPGRADADAAAQDQERDRGQTLAANPELLEALEDKLKNPHNIGWFCTDIMIKLGLLGTIIGFVLMLGSVVNVSDFDANAMQNILKQMSSGMGTALYTTFAGLVCSILTAAQFFMLDQAADELVDEAKGLTQARPLR